MSKRKNPQLQIMEALLELNDLEIDKVGKYILKLAKSSKITKPRLKRKNTPQDFPKRLRRVERLPDGLTKEKKSKSKTPLLPKILEDTLVIKNQVIKNKFFELGVHNQHKKDVAIDKKLSGGNKLTPKGTRVTMIDVECQSCGKIFTTSQQFVYKDPDGNVHFTCDRCIVRAHKSK